jgi:hypothetical protein
MAPVLAVSWHFMGKTSGELQSSRRGGQVHFSVIDLSRMVNRRGRKMYQTPDFAVLLVKTSDLLNNLEIEVMLPDKAAGLCWQTTIRDDRSRLAPWQIP